jgi:hypothetical protein
MMGWKNSLSLYPPDKLQEEQLQEVSDRVARIKERRRLEEETEN